MDSCPSHSAITELHATLQKAHCGAMSEHMRGNTFGFQRGALRSRRVRVLVQDVLDTIAGEGLPTSVAEDGRLRLAIPVEDEFAFQAPIEGYQTSDEWVSAGTSWSEKVQKKYFVMLRDGNFGLVTIRVIGVPNPFFRLTSLVNPSGSHNLEPAN